MSTDIPELIERVQARRPQAIARAISVLERREGPADELLAALYPHGGRAHIVGVTGPAGSGKSTMVSELALELRRRGRTVGILAIDPSSSYSGGAILGDRVRMDALSGDDGVYIRSLATRGATGGLSRAALDAVDVLDAAGVDVILLETVGVGQSEVDVISVAHTIVVVSVPGMGDDIQAIKAGLMEIADIHVVNKSDHHGAGRTVADLRDMVQLSRRFEGPGWRPPVLTTQATAGEGIATVIDNVDEHRTSDTGQEAQQSRLRRNAGRRLRWALHDAIDDTFHRGESSFDAIVERLVTRDLSPTQAAAELLTHYSAPLADASGPARTGA